MRMITKQNHIELTTIIGCKSMCKYCPQTTFVREYFKDNPNREKELTAKNLEKYLKNIPSSIPISMAGFSEPFAATEIVKICDVLAEQNRKVFINTTLFNVESNVVNKIFSKYSYEFVQIHIPDKNNFTNIVVDNEYKRKIATVITNIDPQKTKLIFTCLGEISEDLDVFIKRFDVPHFTNYGEHFIRDRSGLVDPCLLDETIHHKGEIICAKTQNNLVYNVLLPDGSLSLCCMDFGLKNIIGDIGKNTYEEIMNSEKIKQIKLKMKEDNNDLICRSCHFAGRVSDMINKSENTMTFKYGGNSFFDSF